MSTRRSPSAFASFSSSRSCSSSARNFCSAASVAALTRAARSALAALAPLASRQYDNNVWRSWPEASRTVTSESHDDKHAKLAVQHFLKALTQGHKRAAFDSGVMAEEGFGTPVNLENAYLVYILGCSARDERAIAKVRELRANNNVSAHLFVALGTAYDRGMLAEEVVRGNETLEDLRELYLIFEPPGNHP